MPDCCRNYGCSDQGSVRDCLRGKNATELIDGIPWIQYPSWGAHDLINIPSKDSFIGAVLVTDGMSEQKNLACFYDT